MWKLTMLCVFCVCDVALGDKAYMFSKLSNKIVKAMDKEDIQIDIFPELPSKFLKVYYNSGARVNLGNELTPTQVKDTPMVYWETDFFQQKYYTLIFSDPDIPNRENATDGEFLHWLVVNIRGTMVPEADELFEYVPPAPIPGSGLHRCVFMVFEQENGEFDLTNVKGTDNRTIEGRELFSTNNFVIQNDLIMLPLAGNFFMAQYDDYVPSIYERFGIEMPTHGYWRFSANGMRLIPDYS
ncbi:Phosphatidylethanolamine-binding protein [Cinara cedri]|uniref:Phosphatidylethanolamine-binding protein n=1 Tax=Cinara cedri TaxID=506608 RepID=A0A5E4MV01_9HEMI|nr:Phosphatidylethanolamine-binding protein [Cinara cedri]